MTDAAFWNNIAERYASKPVENPDAFERKIDITTFRLTAQSTVLDIGCGTGSPALRLAPFAAHVHGIDAASEMIRIARDKATAQKVKNVSFHVAPFDDGFDLFEDASLDGICAYSLLHLLEDRPAALERIHRLLKPGGFFVSSTVCLGESRIPYAPLLRAMRWVGKAPLVKIVSKRVVEEEVRRAGFVECSQPEVGTEAVVAFIVASKPRRGG